MITNPLHRPGRRGRTGFTLVELLVVVAIIAALVGILLPSIRRAQLLSYRTGCASNIREIVRGAQAYAADGTLHRGTAGRAQSLPVGVAPNESQWWDLQKGNSASLWLLMRHGDMSGGVFTCPSMSSSRGDEPAVLSDGSFQAGNRNTLSYSYISMLGHYTRDGRTRPMSHWTAMDTAPAGLMIVGDLNPRFVQGSGEAVSNPPANSVSHGGQGQNVGRLDGSAQWLTDSTYNSPVREGENIYKPSSGSGQNGQRTDPHDVYLLP